MFRARKTAASESARSRAATRRLTRPPARAFTLVELLVVVGIVALLVAILVPSLHRAREYALDAKCRSNLRQLWKVLHGSEGVKLPAPQAWVSVARGKGGRGVLTCPKHDVDAQGGGREVIPAANVEEIAPPPSARFDENPESNTAIFTYTEQENYVLPVDVAVNISQPGYYDSTDDLTPGVIPAGTIVDCQFLFHDPVGSEETHTSGAITLGGEILGVVCLDANLDATDAVLGRPGTAYHGGQSARGYEMGAEIVELSPDRRTYTIHHHHSTYPGENTRILTVPAGVSSYGMNNQVKPVNSRPGQLLLLEYDRTVADADRDAVGNQLPQLAPRHLGKVNVIFLDGSVRGMWPEDIRPDDEMWQP